MTLVSLAERRLVVLFDADCGVCTRAAQLLRRLDRDGRLFLLPLQASPGLEDAPPIGALLESLHVRDADGRWSAGGSVIVRISREIPVLRPISLLARAPGVRRFVELAYALVATRRHGISRLLGHDACRVEAGRR